MGILLDAAAENRITENIIFNSTGWAIQLKSSSDTFMSSKNNSIFHNNFINNQQSDGLDVSIPGIWTYPGVFVAGVGNIWDDGYQGNYWSDYLTRYPNSTEIPSTGTGNTPFAINENNVDNHPLLNPFNTSSPPFQSNRPSPSNTTSTSSPTSSPSLSPSPTLSPSPFIPEFQSAMIVLSLMAATGFLLVFKRRRKRR